MVIKPLNSSSVPAAPSQPNLNVVALGASPSAVVMSPVPGQVNSVVPLARKSFTGPHWASPKTTMMIRYGA